MQQTHRFYCKTCNYGTNHKNNFSQHLSTKKHAMNYDKKILPDTDTSFTCKTCHETFACRSSLWRHKKNSLCKNTESKEIVSITESGTNVDAEKMNAILVDCLTTITKQSNTIKEQSTALREQNKILSEQNETLKKMVPKIGNQTNNFNLQVYLNETCKDAISLPDFIKGITVQLHDLIQARKTNLLLSTKEVFLKNLKETECVHRPIQCTDVKRNTMYIKEEGAWNKDVGNKKLKTAMTKLSHKYVSVVKDWQDTNAEHMDTDNGQVEYVKVVQSATQDILNETKGIQKAVKDIARAADVQINSSNHIP